MSYSNEWDMQQHIIFGPALGLGHLVSLNFNNKVFLYQTLCVKDIEHIDRDFRSVNRGSGT